MIRIHSVTGKSIALSISAHETTAYLMSGSNPSCIAPRKKKAINKGSYNFPKMKSSYSRNKSSNFPQGNISHTIGKNAAVGKTALRGNSGRSKNGNTNCNRQSKVTINRKNIPSSISLLKRCKTLGKIINVLQLN
jgi:hypothetical protein